MPLTEDELNAIEAQSLLVRERALEHHGVTAARWLQDSTRTYVPALIADLREAQAEARRLREALHEAYGSLIYELEQMEQAAKAEGREVWDRQLMGGGHFRVHDIQEVRAALAATVPAPAREGT